MIYNFRYCGYIDNILKHLLSPSIISLSPRFSVWRGNDGIDSEDPSLAIPDASSQTELAWDSLPPPSRLLKRRDFIFIVKHVSH